MKTFEPNKNIKELGIDTTRKFVVVNDLFLNQTKQFNKGEILTLSEDDNTIRPEFRNKDGVRWYVSLCDLAYYEEEMKEGDLVYVSEMSEEDAMYYKCKRIFLRKCNNGVLCIVNRDNEKYLKGNTFDVWKWGYAIPIPKTKKITLDVTDEQEREINKLLNK